MMRKLARMIEIKYISVMFSRVKVSGPVIKKKGSLLCKMGSKDFVQWGGAFFSVHRRGQISDEIGMLMTEGNIGERS